jgi:hypothetical protein
MMAVRKSRPSACANARVPLAAGRRPPPTIRAPGRTIANTANDMRRMHMLAKHTFRREPGGSPAPVEFVSGRKSALLGASGPAPRSASPRAEYDLRRVARRSGSAIDTTERYAPHAYACQAYVSKESGGSPAPVEFVSDDMRRMHMLGKHTFDANLAAARHLWSSRPHAALRPRAGADLRRLSRAPAARSPAPKTICAACICLASILSTPIWRQPDICGVRFPTESRRTAGC